MTDPPAFALDDFPSEAELAPLWLAAWHTPLRPGYAAQLQRSLCHVTARQDGRLVGFVNVGWDGGVHAFLLDTTVDPAFGRLGIGTRLVHEAAEAARARGAEWLHVDFEPALEAFYRGAGFRPTQAGLMKLR